MSYLLKFSETHISKTEMEMPFTAKFNFSQMVEFWESLANKKEGSELADIAKPCLEKINEVPILKTGFSDPAILEDNEVILKKMFYPLFPSITTNNEIKTVGLPFVPVWFNMTERFERIIQDAGGPENIQMRVEDPDMTYIYGCVFILNFKYNAKINYTQTFFFDIPNEKTGVLRHYRAHYNADFSNFIANENFIPLTKKEIQELVDNFDNVDLWKEKMPPNSHRFEGFAILKLFDVTMEEAVSSMKYNLLSRDALLSEDIIEKIRINISSLLNIPNVKIGVASYDENQKILKPMGKGYWNSISLTGYKMKSAEKAFCDVSGHQVLEDKKPFALSVINEMWREHSRLAKKVVKQGLHSYAAIPLLEEGSIIGVLEIGSETAGAITSATAKMLESITPLFATALKRSQDEYDIKLEAIIQEKCTAIHPSVSWRFLEAAANLVENQRLSGTSEMEEIIFSEIYPLYGQSDIKSSSTERNIAIQADMIEQLIAANKVLKDAIELEPLPIYKKMAFRIDNYISRVKKGLSAGDEIKVLEFLQREIYPTFKYIKATNKELAKAVESYSQLLDMELEVIYKKRKDYEESVAAINDNIAAYVESAQQAAQNMFPHYFEKYQTDGVEHNMYIGQSLVKNKKFHKLYLQNLRIWQLMVICESENVAYRLKDELPVPLRVASLVLIHSNPITIRFRKEEKRFDVEGAYNIRYEIIKKRIDKALVSGSKERLTQAGKLAIVYSQESEAEEYMSYLEYLQSIDYIGPHIENLELKDLQGVSGMRALRVEITYHPARPLVPQSKAFVLKEK
ncbi:MAG: GAF domain-containing protein [Saprospiraceae bacterium]